MGYIVSLVLHICILLLFYKNISFIIPSQSDGITVAIITQSDNPLPIAKPIVINQPNNDVPKINQADIQLPTKKKDIPIESSSNNKITIIKKVKPLPQKVEHNQKIDITNQLLGAINDNQPIVKNRGNYNKGNNSGSGDKVAMANYADSVINLVRPHVIIPDNLDTKLITIVKVIILPNMDVYAVKVIKSSGNLIYDSNVVDAIKIVKKFPNIPDGENWINYRVINLTFKSK
jgi:colicin import membrane protein